VTLVGEMLGQYKLVSVIGEGGMGVVYVGEHAAIGRKVAIKVLHPEYAAQPAIVTRFFNEARAANLIRHPSIVDIHDFGESSSSGAYIVMELLEGESLAGRMARDRRLAPAVAVRIVQRIASALGAAHARGIVHRDLKPDNVFLVPDPDHPDEERVKILDFGIAKLVETAGGRRESRTRTGAVLGTPLYMSPEQADGAKSVDFRADIYALGVVAYEMLCGEPPFIAEGYGHILAMHLMQDPPPLRRRAPAVPEALEREVLRALAKDPAARHGSMEELSAAFGAAIGLAGKAAHAPAPGPAAGAARTGAASRGESDSALELAATRPTPPPDTAALAVAAAAAAPAPPIVKRPSTLAASAAELRVTRSRPLARWLVPAAAVGVLAGGAGLWAALHDWGGSGDSADGTGGDGDAPGGDRVKIAHEDSRGPDGDETTGARPPRPDPDDGTAKPDTAAPAPRTSASAPRTSASAPHTSAPAPKTSAPRPDTAAPAPETAEATTAPDTSGPDTTVKITIESSPPGALVFVGKETKPAGRTPWAIVRGVHSGRLRVRLVKPGFREEWRLVPTKSDGTLHVDLTPVGRPGPKGPATGKDDDEPLRIIP